MLHLLLDEHLSPTIAEQILAVRPEIRIIERTLAQYDFGGLIRSLCRLWDHQAELDWTDRVLYLSR